MEFNPSNNVEPLAKVISSLRRSVMFIAERPVPYCAPEECHVARRPLIFVKRWTRRGVRALK